MTQKHPHRPTCLRLNVAQSKPRRLWSSPEKTPGYRYMNWGLDRRNTSHLQGDPQRGRLVAAAYVCLRMIRIQPNVSCFLLQTRRRC